VYVVTVPTVTGFVNVCRDPSPSVNVTDPSPFVTTPRWTLSRQPGPKPTFVASWLL
jgi:hypothetical protein